MINTRILQGLKTFSLACRWSFIAVALNIDY